MPNTWPRRRDVKLILGDEALAAAVASTPLDSAGDVSSLAHVGFPALSATTVFLSRERLEEWEQRRVLSFPPVCCACHEPALELLPTVMVRGLLVPTLEPGPIGACVPHCVRHAQKGHALLLGRFDSWSRETTHLTLVGFSAPFLAAAHELNREGDTFPPWKAFPDMDPESSGWRQGNGEYWWHSAWAPFWEQLDDGAKRAYLGRWRAPHDWIARLTRDSSVGS